MLNNPFPGPQPYRATDRDRFHGRADMAHSLECTVLSNRCVTVYGPSGAGKSSLVQAAVIPGLIAEHDIRVALVDGWPEGENAARWLAGKLYADIGFGDVPADMTPDKAILSAAQRAHGGRSGFSSSTSTRLSSSFIPAEMWTTPRHFSNAPTGSSSCRSATCAWSSRSARTTSGAFAIACATGGGCWKMGSASVHSTSPAQAHAISRMTDPARRNLKITQGYHDLKTALTRSFGAKNVTWCGYATWASNTAGTFIRGEEVPKLIRACLGGMEQIHAMLERVNGALGRVHPAARLDGLFITESIEQTFRDVTKNVGQGNLIVFRELAPLYAAWLATFPERPAAYDSKVINAFIASNFTPGPIAQGGQDLTLSIPGVDLDLGKDVPSLASGRMFPDELRAATYPPLVELLAKLDRTTDTVEGSAAVDWCDLGDRMNFVADFFRTHQQDQALFQQPFTDEQVTVIASGGMPDGEL